MDSTTEQEMIDEKRKRHRRPDDIPSFDAPQPITHGWSGEQQCDTAGPLRGPSSRDLLLQRAHLLRMRAGQLEALADQLPNRMTPEAAQGLIQLLIR